MTLDRWDARIARARHLAAEYPSAAEVLSFYAEVATVQRSLAERIAPPRNLTGLAERFAELASAVPEILHELKRTAPEHLARVLTPLCDAPVTEWCSHFSRYMDDDGHEPDDVDELRLFVVEMMLQPVAEAAVGGAPGVAQSGEGAAARCPGCGGKPVVGVLREDAQSAARSLVCGLCFMEWRWPRIRCPACGETDFAKLVVYTAETIRGRQVDACETCRRYLHTIDLSKNALAIPPVDELAGLPLDVWARGEGYRKLRPNVLRV